MTAELDARPVVPVVPPDGPVCSVVIPVPLSELLPGFPGDGYSLERCGEPAVGYFAGRCRHDHVRDGWLCAAHAEQVGQGGCRACIEDPRDPHDCPVALERQGVPGGR
jgi:hypothetical protein